MKYLAALSLLGVFLIGCPEEESAFDEFNDLLPLEVGAFWQYDCNSDGAVWEIDVTSGMGDGDLESFDYSFKVDGAPSYHHDLALGDIGDDHGWYEAVDEPERPDLYLSLPAEEGFEWTHHYAVSSTTWDWLVTYEGREINGEPLTAEDLDALIGDRPIKPFLNTRNVIYRQENLKAATPSKATVVALIAAHNNLLKRPVLIVGDEYIIGNNLARAAELLGHAL